MWQGGSLFEDNASEVSGPPPAMSKPPWAQSWAAEAQGTAVGYQPLRASQFRQPTPKVAIKAEPQDSYIAAQPSPREAHAAPATARSLKQQDLAPPPLEMGALLTQRSHGPARNNSIPEEAPSPDLTTKRSHAPSLAPSVKVEAAIKASGLPKTARRPTHLDLGKSSAAASPQPVKEGSVVKMGRREAWARFLAYEGCMQICLSAKGLSSEPAIFLDSGCARLRGAFGFGGLLLKPADDSTPETGSTLTWDDAEVQTLQTLPMQPTTVQVDSIITRTSLVKCSVVRLSSYNSRIPSMAAAQPNDSLFVRLKPRCNEGDAWHWTKIDAVTGMGREAEPLALDQVDLQHSDLLLEVVGPKGTIAEGHLSAGDLYKMCGSQYNHDLATPGKPGLKKRLLTLFSKSVKAEDMYGKQWVQISHQARPVGNILLQAWLAQSERTTLSPAPAVQQPQQGPQQADAAAEQITTNAKGFQQVTAWQVYDLAMEAALRGQSCGPRSLPIKGEWQWLLREFAATYGIRDSYANLTFLRWILMQGNATATVDCVSLLCSLLAPLKSSSASGKLLQQEGAILSRIEDACEELLALVFENYYSLCEKAQSGILDGGVAAPDSPAPVLKPAVNLCQILKDVLKPVDQVWMTERFKIAAVARYRRLSGACDDQLPFGQHQKGDSPDAGIALESDAEVAYARLGALCQAIKNELQNDLNIHDASILPAYVNLPQVTAAEYSQEFLGKLVSTLAQFPPPQPSRPAVDLLVTVGQQQEYLAWHNLLPSRGEQGSLDALQVFGPYVANWINGSQDALCLRCRSLTQSTQAAVASHKLARDGGMLVSPLVEEMLQRLDAEILRYERVIQYWPVFGPLLEGAVCAALRETTSGVLHQCGVSHTGTPHTAAPQPPQRLGGPLGSTQPASQPGGWKVAAHHGSTASGQLQPNEVILLNSLRRLLAVVPQTEHKLSGWAGGAIAPLGMAASQGSHAQNGPPSPAAGGREYAGPGREVMPDGQAGPGMGAQFAQLVKEVRSAYGGAVKASAEKVARALGQKFSILRLLQHHGLSPEPAMMSSQLEPALAALEGVMEGLKQHLDARVYVALGRGLWDCNARDVFNYVEALQEGRENRGAWRGRQNASAALAVVDSFFTSVISGALAHDVQAKDLDLPLHSARTHDLLADNTAAINLSYTVY